MTSFRVRQWGAADWCQLDISCDDEELEELLGDKTRNMLLDADMHSQELNEDRWEDL